MYTASDGCSDFLNLAPDAVLRGVVIGAPISLSLWLALYAIVDALL